jgi:hypothetical protein
MMKNDKSKNVQYFMSSISNWQRYASSTNKNDFNIPESDWGEVWNFEPEFKGINKFERFLVQYCL